MCYRTAMPTQELVRKLDNQVRRLSADVTQVRGLFFGMFQDEEGPYRKTFVAKVKKRLQEKATHMFVSPEQFLKHAGGKQK